MQQAKTKKSISVPEMGRMLGLGKVESYWLGQEKLFSHHPGGWPYASDAG